MAGNLSDAKQSFFIFVRDPNTNKIERVAIPGDVQVGLKDNPADLTLMGRFAINASEYSITTANAGIINASSDDCIIGIKLISSPLNNKANLLLPQNPREGQLAFVKDMTGTSTSVPVTINPGTGLLIDDKPTALLSASYGSSALAWFDGQWRTIGGGGTGGGGGTITNILGAGGSTVTNVGSVYTVSSSIGVSNVVGTGGSIVVKIGTGTEYQVSSSIGADANASYILVKANANDPNARILSGGVGINILDNGPGNTLVINGITGDGWYTALDVDLTAQGNINPLVDQAYTFTGNPGGTLTKINSSHDDTPSQIISGQGWKVTPSNSNLGLNNGKYSTHTLSSFTIPLANLDSTIDPLTPIRIWVYIASQTQAPQGSGGVGEGQWIYVDDWNGAQYTWSWHCNAGFGGSGNGWYAAIQSPTGAGSTGIVDAYTNPPNVMMLYLPQGIGGRIGYVFRKDIAGNSWPSLATMVPYLYFDQNTLDFNSGTLNAYVLPSAANISWGVTGDPAFSGGSGYSTIISRIRVDYYRAGVGNAGPTGSQGLPGTQGISASWKGTILPHNPYTNVDFSNGIFAGELNSLTASVQIDNSVVATLSGSTFSGPIIATDNPGITGSLTKLRAGLAYLVGVGTVGISTNSLGQVIISGSGGTGTVTSVTASGGSSASHVGTVYTISSSIGADLYASYLIASASAVDPNARVLAAGANITLVDTGPGGTLTIAALAGTGSNVFTGSLTQTGIPGFPYLVGLGSVTISTNSLGQVLVSGSGGGGGGGTVINQIVSASTAGWVTVVDIPFDAQPSQTFTGNSSVTIDGFGFTQLNPANASAAAVVPGTGVQWTNSAVDDIFGGTFSAPVLAIPFQSLFSAYSLPDHDIRIWWWINQDSVTTNFDSAVYGVLLGGTATGFTPTTENITNKKGFLGGAQGYNPQLNINATNYINTDIAGFETYNVQMLQYNRNGRFYAWYIGSGSIINGVDVWPATNQMQLLAAGDATPNSELLTQLPITGSGNPSVFFGLASTGGRAIVESFRKLRFDYLNPNNVTVNGSASPGQGAYYGFVTSSVWWVATGSWQPFVSACPDGIVTDVFSQGIVRSGSTFTVTNGGLYSFHAGFNAYGSDAYISLRLSSSNGIALSRSTYRTDPADQNLVVLDGIFSATIGQTYTLQYVSSGTVFAWTGSNPLPGVDAASMHTGDISIFLVNTSGSTQWLDKGNVLVTTASVSIDGQARTAIQGSGIDAYLWVSGTQSISGAWNSPSAVTGSAARRAVFGGDVVISGTLSVLRGSPFSPWTTLLDVDFTAQPAQTLSSDGFYDIAGLTWFKSNTANENAPTTIGSAGLTFAPVAATDYSNTTRTGPLLWLPLSQSLLLPNLDWTYSFRLWVYVTVDNPSVNFDECIVGLDNNGTTLSMFFARGMDPAGGTGGFMRNIVNGANVSAQNNISFTTSSLNNVMIMEWNVLSRQTTATVNSSTPRLFTHAMSGTVTNSSWPPYQTSTYQSMWDTSTLNPGTVFNALGVVLGAVRGGAGGTHYSCSIGRIKLDYHA